MSQRSVIEINHDYSHAIERDAEAFVRLLDYALGSGSDRAWDALQRYGIRRATQHHHSSTAVVVVTAEGGHVSYVAGFPGDHLPEPKAVARNAARAPSPQVRGK